jgi:hypothetical protein
MNERILTWDGCRNVRDLGGLSTVDGRRTLWGAVVRSDTPARLSPAGWAALHSYGIRTIITLCTHGQVEDELVVRPPYAEIVVRQAAIEDISDAGFVRQWASSGLWSTPLYYHDALRRWPERHAAVISAIAQAGPGGVLFHCIRGNDRTGIIALLLLAFCGVAPDQIVADYALSPDPERDAILAERQVSIGEALSGALAGLDLEGYLRAGGASQADLQAVRMRLLGPG